MRSLFYCQNPGRKLAKALFFLCRSDVFRLNPLLSYFLIFFDGKVAT